MDEAIEILVCVGCAMLAANGEDIGDGGDGVPPLDGWDNGWLLVVGEPWGFATSPCDGCGSRLGGDRFIADTFPKGRV